MLILNTSPDYGAPLVAADADTLGLHAPGVVAEHLRLTKSDATPLYSMPDLAAALGLGAVTIKDEGQRLGLGSFKALGGAYAVARVVLELAGESLGRRLVAAELHDTHVKALASEVTFCCATDGNHGRSVAWGASLLGAKSVIFVHEGVSEARAAAIAAFGANIVRVRGTYDDSVTEAARVAESEDWSLLSDTSWPGYERVPGLVMQGYTVLVQEALAALQEPPTHLFVQAGVGGLAAAMAGHLALQLGDQRPFVVVVEPDRAACVFATARAGAVQRLEHQASTVMAMLECYEPSIVAWRVLSRVADAFMTVTDEDAVSAMRRLAHPADRDPFIIAGESGGAGLAGLLVALEDPQARRALRLDAQSRILLVNTEGATDPALYRQLVGRDPAGFAEVTVS